MFSHPPANLPPKELPYHGGNALCINMHGTKTLETYVNPVGGPCMPQHLVVVVFGPRQHDLLAFSRSAKKASRTAFKPSTDCVLCRPKSVLTNTWFPLSCCMNVRGHLVRVREPSDTASACFEPSSFTTLRSSFPFQSLHLIFHVASAPRDKPGLLPAQLVCPTCSCTFHFDFQDWFTPLLTVTMTMTMTHSEKSNICQMKAWPYRQECRGHDPTKKNLLCC